MKTTTTPQSVFVETPHNRPNGACRRRSAQPPMNVTFPQDYCCFLCSQGAKRLPVWESACVTPDDDDENNNNGKLTSPEHFGWTFGFLLTLFDGEQKIRDADELLSVPRYYTLEQHPYDWDSGDFEWLDYADVLAKGQVQQTQGFSVWYSRILQSWVINMCPFCQEVMYGSLSSSPVSLLPKSYQSTIATLHGQTSQLAVDNWRRRIRLVANSSRGKPYWNVETDDSDESMDYC
jgi:hypothetical protein